MSGLDRLPPETLLHLSGYLRTQDRLSLGKTCRSVRRVLKQSGEHSFCHEEEFSAKLTIRQTPFKFPTHPKPINTKG